MDDSFGTAARNVMMIGGKALEGFERGREMRRQMTLRDLAGDYYAAPSENGLAALARAGGDVTSAANYGRMHQQDRERRAGQIAANVANAPAELRPQLYAQHRDELEKIGAIDLPDVWSENLLPIAQDWARRFGGSAQEMPAGVREFNTLTEGFSDDDKTLARRIHFGLDARKSSALPYSPGTATGSDGRERLYRFDKRTGEYVVADGGGEAGPPMPAPLPPSISGGSGPSLGGAPSPGAPSMPPSGSLASLATIAKEHGFDVTSGLRTPQENASLPGSIPNSRHLTGDAIDLSLRGKSPEQVAALTAEMHSQGYSGGYDPNGTAPHLHFERRTAPTGSQQPRPNAFVSQAPEERKYAEAYGTKRGEAQGELDGTTAARQANVELIMRDIDETLATIDTAIKQVPGFGTTGMAGVVSSKVPGTRAYDLRQTILTVKANLGFARLQAMRDASPTGGALGQVAVQELEALQASVGSLDQGQTDEQLMRNLRKAQTHYLRWRQAVLQSAQRTGLDVPQGDAPAAREVEWVRDPRTGKLTKRAK